MGAPEDGHAVDRWIAGLLSHRRMHYSSWDSAGSSGRKKKSNALKQSNTTTITVMTPSNGAEAKLHRVFSLKGKCVGNQYSCLKV